MAISTVKPLSLQQQVFECIAKVSGNSDILASPKAFLKHFKGDHAKAMFFSQLLYWGDKGKRHDGWFYKSYSDWAEELFISPYQIRKYTKELKAEGLIQARRMKANAVPTVYYKINSEVLFDWIVKNFNNGLLNNLTIESENISQSTTKTTAETTPENTEKGYNGFLPDGEKTKTFSFTSFCELFTEEIDNPDIIPAVEYYLATYEECMGNEHPNLKFEQWKRVVERIMYVDNGHQTFDVDLGNIEDMIYRHFLTEYENCDYNILHYISGEIAKNRFYEECYRF